MEGGGEEEGRRTVDGEDGGEDGFDFVKGEDGAGEEGLQEGAVAVVVCIFLVGHGVGSWKSAGIGWELQRYVSLAPWITWIACLWRVLKSEEIRRVKI